jgi:hypothetical protein
MMLRRANSQGASLFAGVGIGAVGLLLASAATHASGAMLIVAGALFISAARAGVAATYAPDQMPLRNVRATSVGLAVVGCIFVALGVAELEA